MTILPCYI